MNKVPRSTLLLILLLLTGLSAHSQRVGLVLSGGGARGLAHIGVMKALEENNIPIDYIAGTSAGAIVGCMYVMGLSPTQMDSIVHTDEFYNWANGILDENYTYYFRKREENASWINLKFSLDSVIQTTLPTSVVSSVPFDYSLMQTTASVIAKANYNFDSLFVPFRCVASDIENKKSHIFKDGDLGLAVRASSAYPFYFKPVIFDGKILYDGGMYNNFPSDVMLNDFQPDIILGVNSGGTTVPTSEGNIISQIRAMMTTPTNFTVICENGILIEPNTDKFGLFDFSKIDELIEEGYKGCMAQMDKIKFNIQRRISADSLREKRNQFRSGLHPILVDNVVIEGVNSKQADYVRNILKPSFSPIPLERLKASYFQLVADQNIKSIFPTLKFNRASGYYDMKVRIQREKDLITQFGGSISSRPISEAFVGLQYNLWHRKAYSFNGNFYFGKLYTSGQVRVRMDAPTLQQYFLEAEATLNQYDFYRSSTALFSDQKPAYIIKSDQNYGMNFGLPARNKGKIIASFSYARVSDYYYQNQNFLQKDTADRTILKGVSGAIVYERNTRNRKQYASQGTFLNLTLRYVNMNEYSIPGSTSVDKTLQKDYHDWFQAKLIYDNYYKRKGRLRLGFYVEAAASNLPFFANYTATVLNSPSFEPTQETQTLFLSNFHAHNFVGAGLRNVVMVRGNLDFRIEGYIFQPYRELVKTADLKTMYGETLSRRYYIGSLGAVFHSPVGPIAAFLNYYDDRKNPFSFLFHVGFMIFNKNAIN